MYDAVTVFTTCINQKDIFMVSYVIGYEFTDAK